METGDDLLKTDFRRAPLFITLLLLSLTVIAAGFLTGCSGEEADEMKAGVSFTDVIINEAVTSNTESAKAYDGRFYDWIELYNPTSRDISLDGYFLSDDLESLQKTSLKGQSIAAGGYLIIYCSGLNITDEKGFLHTGFKLSATNGETVYLSGDKVVSSVTIPASEVNASYGLGSDGVYGWLKEPTPGKKNDSVSETVRSDVRINEYMTSNTFTIYDCEGDYGDWAELYNRSSKPVDISGYGLTDNEADPDKYTFPEGTVIKGRSYLLVFCDGKKKTDKSGMLHTGFSLNANDRALLLYTTGKQLVSKVEIHDLPANISCGWSDEERDWRFFARPTPGSANSTTAFRELSADLSPDLGSDVIISETLSASGSTGGVSKYDYIELYNSSSSDVSLKGYTLSFRQGEPAYRFPDYKLKAGGYLLVICDGTDKRENKWLHAPLKISTGGVTLYLADAHGKLCDVFSTGKGRNGVSSGRLGNDTSKRVFFTSPTPGQANESRHYLSFAPQPAFSREGGVVRKGTEISLSAPEGCTVVYTTDGSEPSMASETYHKPIVIRDNTVIRAAAYGSNMLLSDCATETFLTQNPHEIPIMCISGKPTDISKVGGIFLNENNSAEKKVNIEYFDRDGRKEVAFPCGIKLFGYSSRLCSQKGVKISLREVYGVNKVTYPFFSQNDRAAKTFSTLLLRPSGEDQIYSKLRDELVPALIRGKMYLDYQEFQPCALYLNGEYWGAYYIREHLGADYLESYYGYRKGDYDLVKAQHLVQEGNLKAYGELTAFCKNNDLTILSNYEYICNNVDLESLINFWIVETYFGNTDTVNIRCYKHHDGKWRWMVYDLDWSMQANKITRSKNFIDMHLLDPAGHGIGHYDNSLMRKLLENEEFRTRFITAYCYHMNTTFSPDRAVAILDKMADDIDGEIKLNEKVWHTPKYSKWSGTTVPYLRNYLKDRPGEIRKNLMESFHLSEKDWSRYQELAENYKPESSPVK